MRGRRTLPISRRYALESTRDMSRLRLLIADDHQIVAAGLKSLLESQFELVGSVEDGVALLEAAERLRPDVILLDISMPLMNGIEAARRISKSNPPVKIIILTMHADASFVKASFEAGASGYLLKQSAPDDLITAINEVAQGGFYISPALAETMGTTAVSVRSLREASFGKLTQRQREVLQLVAEGHGIKDIATILGISPKTVEYHKYRVMDELGIRTTAELTAYAIRHGIVEGK